MALASCAGFWGKTPAPVLPDRCGPEITADIPEAPKIPDGAGFPRPVTAEERAAVAAYLEWLASFGDHDTLITERLRLAQKGCLTKAGTTP